MYSAYKLNKQGDNIQPWCTPFLIWNQSVVPCPVLTVASWPAYRFLKRQVRWSGIPISQEFPQFIVIHTVKGFGIVNKAEIDVFLELFCFLDDPADVGNLISGSSALSKTSLNIWKFTIHVLLKPGLENFKHYFTSVWDESNCVVVWAFFGIAFGLQSMGSQRVRHNLETEQQSPGPSVLLQMPFFYSLKWLDFSYNTILWVLIICEPWTSRCLSWF